MNYLLNHNSDNLTNFIIKDIIENISVYSISKQLTFTENIYHNLLLKLFGNCLQLTIIKVLF